MAEGWASYAYLLIELVERELFLFALFWFALGAIDEFAVDCVWAWLRWGKGRSARGPAGRLDPGAPLRGPVAVLVPAWREADVIATTISCMLAAWRQAELRLYIGCYRNDSATVRAAMAAARADVRVRIVILDQYGPTTKADCLNRLDRAIRADEARSKTRFRAIVFHDAEDLVHPQALVEMDRALDTCEFVQLPVRPEPLSSSRWISGHYLDEFAEAHAKTMVVREALGAGLPAAGVGFAIARDMRDRLAAVHADALPFATDSLTEDYELGLVVASLGGRCRFLRARDDEMRLVATRSLFPGDLASAVRQKNRWIHGIALQGWDRLGWAARPVDVWMVLRDRRGPLAALVLCAAYLLLLLESLRLFLPIPAASWRQDPMLSFLVLLCAANLCWRALIRAIFTSHEYGLAEGLRSILRIPIANIIQIMAGRRAMVSYMRALRGAALNWDKTLHREHAAGFALRMISAPPGSQA